MQLIALLAPLLRNLDHCPALMWAEMIIKIVQVGSPIRRPSSQRATLIGLGLSRIGRTVEVPDTPAIRGMIAKVKHLIRVYPGLKVTFDSNTYRRAVDPSRFLNDAKARQLRKINAALNDGRIAGFLSETLVTLEGVQNAQRGAYFSSVTAKVSRAVKTSADGEIKRGYLIAADDSLHPGLHPIVTRWLARADSLGFRFLRAPRIGGPRPVTQMKFVQENEDEHKQRLERYMNVARIFEARGVGIARLKAIADRISTRTGSTGAWYSALNNARDDHERREIEKAVAEWADADTIAAHIAYKIDVLCSEDLGNSAGGASILDASNREWLKQAYGIRIVSLEELGGTLGN